MHVNHNHMDTGHGRASPRTSQMAAVDVIGWHVTPQPPSTVSLNLKPSIDTLG